MRRFHTIYHIAQSQLRLIVLFFACLLCNCNNSSKSITTDKNKLFTSIPSSYSNIEFINKLEFNNEFNIYTYRSFYNGGGVGLADVNNDGLIDVFFTGNMQPNRLYLNKGNFRFEDITEKAGIGKKGKWSTGVSMADVNGDGYIDIYVCNSGNIKGDPKRNELYINNKNLTFSEKAREYGVDDDGFTTHAAFFDYDKDDDLDLFILNNSSKAIGNYTQQKYDRTKRDSLGGDKLLRNNNGKFEDVSKQAGIYGSVIGFGLGISVSDINNDGWQDIYITNDFFERDYLYLNNKKGGFIEDLPNQIMSLSASAMGADIADINNDGLQDIYVTEMLAEHEDRLKTNTAYENWDKYRINLMNGYHYQFSRNTLQLNNGNNTFSEVGRLSGIHATDWSWGPLVLDLNNDGLKDIFIANGIYKDLTNQDYIQYLSNEEFAKTIIIGQNIDYKKLIDLIPSTPIPNYAYMNKGNLTFKNMAEEWGLDEPSFSNGSAYADLDNDGDLDLVINNENMVASLYRNESVQQHPENKFLKVKLQGQHKNTSAIGAKVTLYYSNTLSFQEQMPTRGFESTVDNRLNFGLGKSKIIDSLIVIWPNGTSTIKKNVQPNQQLTLKQEEGTQRTKKIAKIPPSIFQESKNNFGINFNHQEGDYSNVDRERLTFHMPAYDGPHMTKGDINNDGLNDFFICGAKGQAGAIYIQGAFGKFNKSNEALLEQDKLNEDVDCLLFDADNDHDLDLFVCSGGNEVASPSSSVNNRLYINDGKGNFTKSLQKLPTTTLSESTSCVAASDYDGDGDQDLFVGVRLKIASYGMPANGYLLQNNGKGLFKDVTATLAPQLIKTGMITDAEWFDYDKDGKPDLVVSGEYMPVKIFHNEGQRLKEVTKNAGLENSNGWWNKLLIKDLNSDGYPDIIAGNHGLNSRFKASIEKPISMYINDFDNNGTIEQIICSFNGSKSYPMSLRHDLVAQIPSLKEKYLKYDNYKNQTISDIFSSEQLANAVKLEAYNLESSIFLNNKNGTFSIKALPVEAQVSSVYGILAEDFNNDGIIDLLLTGNFFRSKPEVGIYDASYGLALLGKRNGDFIPMKAQESGISIKGEVRDILKLDVNKSKIFIFSLKNSAPKLYGLNKSSSFINNQ